MSQKIGISAESYQKWDYVMSRAGTSVDNLKGGMKTLSTQAEKNSSSFQKLGISQQEVATLSKEDLFGKVVEGLSGMEDGTERTALATELLGKAGADLGPLLNEGSDAINEQMKLAEDYGMVMSDAAVKASADFEDAQTTFSGVMTGMKNKMYAEFLPGLTDVMNGLSAVLVGDESGFGMISDGMDKLIDGVGNALDGLSNLFSELIPRLVPIILEMLPMIVEAAVQIITALVTALSSNTDMLASAVLQIINALVNGIIALLPVLITAGVQIIASLVKGIISNRGQIISTLKSIGSSIKGIFTSLVSSAKKWGADFIDGFKNAIKSKISAIVSTIKGVADKIKSFLHFSRPDEGPLRDYETWGKDFMIGYADSIASNAYRVKDAVESLAGDMVVSPSISPVSASVGASGGMFDIDITINADPSMDVRALADEVGNVLVNRLGRQVRAYG